MATVLVAACLERDFDAATGTCQQVIWIPQPSFLPELSVADAQLIGVNVAHVLAVAFVFRLLRKFVENS